MHSLNVRLQTEDTRISDFWVCIAHTLIFKTCCIGLAQVLFVDAIFWYVKAFHFVSLSGKGGFWCTVVGSCREWKAVLGRES